MRKIEINGKTVVIETGITPKKKSLIFGRPKSDIRLLAEQIDAGESVYIPVSPDRLKQGNLYSMGRQINKRLLYRTEGEGVRLFCVGYLSEKSDRSAVDTRKSNGASAAAAW